jgi:hypothetical protein
LGNILLDENDGLYHRSTQNENRTQSKGFVLCFFQKHKPVEGGAKAQAKEAMAPYSTTTR